MKRVTVVQYDSVTVVPCDRITVPPSDRLTVTPSHRIAGFTLVEAVISLVIVSVMLTAALSVVSSSRLSQYHTTQDSQGQFLAQSLLTEIMNQAYLDPNGNSGWGPEVGESTPTRAGFDDVDDYDNWTESPPRTQDGSAIAGTTGWSRSVAVAWANPADPNQDAGSETNVKRITVTALFNGHPVRSCWGLVSHHDVEM